MVCWCCHCEEHMRRSNPGAKDGMVALDRRAYARDDNKKSLLRVFLPVFASFVIADVGRTGDNKGSAENGNKRWNFEE
jgi:hypothetical protein